MGLNDLSDFQDAAKAKYSKSLADFDSASIDFFDGEKLIGKLDEIPDEYFKEGGNCLIIKVPSQTVSSYSHISKFHFYTSLIFNNI
jgi:hypothetical protein